MNAFANFMSVNNLKRKDIASFLGVSGAFITQLTSGQRSLPSKQLAVIKANAYGWDTSMLEEKPSNSIGFFSGVKNITHSHEAVAGNIDNAIREVLENNTSESPLVVYLEQKSLEKDAVIANQDATIRNLLKQIETLKKERDELLAEYKSVRKRDAENAAGSLSADAV